MHPRPSGLRKQKPWRKKSHQLYKTLATSIRGLDVVELIQIPRLFLTENPPEMTAGGINASYPVSDFIGPTRFEHIKWYFHLAAPDIPLCTPREQWLCHAKFDQIPQLLRHAASILSHMVVDDILGFGHDHP